MSSRTRSVAVAVSAMNGTSGKMLAQVARVWRYSGRKSWPHSLMQCASSTAMSRTFQRLQIFQKTGQHQPLRRGVEQAVFAVVQTAQPRAAIRPAASEEFRNVAAMPLACSASTWSFISAISGETTTVRPVAHERGQLEAERFAAAGRQQREDVLARQRVADDFLLQRPERGETEVLLQQREQVLEIGFQPEQSRTGVAPVSIYFLEGDRRDACPTNRRLRPHRE